MADDSQRKQAGTQYLDLSYIEQHDLPQLNKILNDIGKDAKFDGITKNLSKQLKEAVETASKSVDLSKVGAEAKGRSSGSKKSNAYSEALAALKEEASLSAKIAAIDRQRAGAGEAENRTLLEARGIYADLLQGARDRAEAATELVKDEGQQAALEKQTLLNTAKAAENEAKVEKARRRSVDAIKEQSAAAKILDNIQSSIVSSLTFLVTKMTVGAVKQFWKDAWQYASEYYDQLNEIRVVTGQTAAESELVGQNLRSLAQDMSVSSRDLAEGAITFYRQGLSDDEVNERLIATTEYARTAGLTFEQSANMITASVNNIATDARGLEMTAQRVADVFLYQGDNAATSGEEIGTAMSRSASLADAAGVSFEMLGAYIATVSERTRQDAGTIGTALNAIMSRLTSVKNKGFNEEDETKVNDVAKALQSVNVQLTDGQGEWRRIEDIFMDVGKVWGDLDDKTRNYLATVMAGTRQQNVFRTLMADLSQVDEGTSRAMELYEGALNSAGTAAQKYTTYQESVTAAHDKMIASLEKLYSLFDSNLLKGLYNAGGSAAQMLYELLGGKDTEDFSRAKAAIDTNIQSLTSLRDEYERLSHVTNPTEDQMKRMDEIVSILSDSYGGFTDSLARNKEVMGEHRGVVASATEELEKYLSVSREIAQAEALSAFNSGKSLVGETFASTESVGSRRGLRSVLSQMQTSFQNWGGGVEYNNISDIFDLLSYITGNDFATGSTRLASGFNTQTGAYTDDYIGLARLWYETLKNQPEIWDAVVDVLREYENGERDAFEIWNEIQTIPSESITTAQNRKALADLLQNQLTFYQNEADYSTLTNAGKEMVDGMVEAYMETLTDPSVFTPDNLEALISDALQFFQDRFASAVASSAQETNMAEEFFGELFTGADEALQSVMLDFLAQVGDIAPTEMVTVAFANISKLYAQIQKQIRDGDVAGAQETKGRLGAELIDLQDMFGFDIGDSWINMLVPMLEETAVAADGAGKKVKDFYDIIAEGRKQEEYNARKEGGFAWEMESLQRMANQGNWSGILDFFRIMQSTDGQRFDDIGKEYGNFNTILDEIARGNYDNALRLIGEAMNQLNSEGVKGATDAYKALNTELEKIQSAAQLREWEGEGFGSVIEQLQGFLSPEDGMNYEGFMGVLNRITEAGALDEFSDVQPGLLEAVAQYREAMSLTEEDEGYENKEETQKEALLEIIDILYNGASAWDTYHTARAGQNIDSDRQTEIANMMALSDSVEDLRRNYDSLSAKEREWAESSLDGLSEMIDGTEEYDDGIKKIRKSYTKLDSGFLEKQGKLWKEASKLAEAAGDEVAGNVAPAYGSYQKRLQQLAEAQNNLNIVQTASDKTTDEYTSALSSLESYLGFAINDEYDLALAEATVAENADIASASAEWLLNMLYALGGSQFTSAGDWIANLANLAAQGDEVAIAAQNAINALQALNGAQISVNQAGRIVVSNLGSVNASNNVRSRRGGGGGGRRGGGGGGSSGDSAGSTQKVASAIEQMTDLMEQIQSLFEFHQSMIQQIQEIYTGKGQLTNLIAVYNEERAAILKNNEVLEQNVRRLETLIPDQQRLVQSMSTSDEAYEDAAKDLDLLQKAHQQYSKQLLENVAAVDKLAKEIEDTYEEIRQKRITVENMILEAIEDREELEERMLQGRLDMEETIMDAIVARYERERDLIIENAELQRDALERESELLDENLAKRKERNEVEKKQQELLEYEQQLVRISADPTRRGEADKLRTKIADLREELAWDTAEAEVEAQKDSIDQQIESLEDYIDYVERYYEDLFAHPKKLIAEVDSILTQTNEEIVAWLQANDEEYQNSSEAMQQSILQTWENTLVDMRGEIVTHWAEVEEIISQGEDYIINFLMQNSAKYREASATQAESYVAEWKKNLKDLEESYRSTYETIKSYSYIPIQTGTYGGSSGSSDGGGGGKTIRGNGSSKSYDLTYMYNGSLVTRTYDSASKANAAASSLKQQASYKQGYVYNVGVSKGYATGGIADFTGPAWLDGTPDKPERILSPYQTELFEDLLASLHSIKTSVNLPSFPTPSMRGDFGDGFVMEGDVIINVDTLSDDEDYEEVATRVMEEIASRMNFGSVVGGIRSTR